MLCCRLQHSLIAHRFCAPSGTLHLVPELLFAAHDMRRLCHAGGRCQSRLLASKQGSEKPHGYRYQLPAMLRSRLQSLVLWSPQSTPDLLSCPATSNSAAWVTAAATMHTSAALAAGTTLAAVLGWAFSDAHREGCCHPRRRTSTSFRAAKPCRGECEMDSRAGCTSGASPRPSCPWNCTSQHHALKARLTKQG